MLLESHMSFNNTHCSRMSYVSFEMHHEHTPFCELQILFCNMLHYRTLWYLQSKRAESRCQLCRGWWDTTFAVIFNIPENSTTSETFKIFNIISFNICSPSAKSWCHLQSLVGYSICKLSKMSSKILEKYLLVSAAEAQSPGYMLQSLV